MDDDDERAVAVRNKASNMEKKITLLIKAATKLAGTSFLLMAETAA
jgi:hypothetical protein